MAFLSSKSLSDLQAKEEVILPFDENRVKSGAYELSLGSEVFRTDSKDRKKEILKDKKEQVVINPGQFALLLSEETVSVPKNKIAFISIKAGIKLRGLINVSGFHVDPGFKGKLLFSVYNAGSGQISLERGKPSFLIWFAELKEEDTKTYKGDHNEQDSILPRYIDDLTKEGSELASPNALLKKINENQIAIENRINIVDERKKLNEYLFKTIIGLLIVIGVKLLWDTGQHYKDYKEGYDKKATEVTTDSTNKLIQDELKTLKIQIEDLKKLKTEVVKPSTENKTQGDGKK